jgi:excinuclease ABC subunit A
VAKMQVDRYKIHDIEAVVDRLAVTDDMKLRLSQSVQKTLQVGKDLMFLLINDDNKLVQYSKHLMCVDTGISYEEPSPNAFSFNSPYGACPSCKGLGNVYSISMDAVLPDRSLSIKEGGIAPLGGERETYMYKNIEAIAKKHKISLDKPISSLSAPALNILLYGNPEGAGNEEPDDFDQNESGFEPEATDQFHLGDGGEGIIPMLKRLVYR